MKQVETKMGIKHLSEIIKIFEEGKNRYFTSTTIRDMTGYNYYTVMETIDYLLQNNFLDKTIVNRSVCYKLKIEKWKSC